MDQTTPEKIQKKRAFNEGDEVISIKDSIIRKGVITTVYTQLKPPLVIVRYEDGTCEKCDVCNLAHAPSAEEKIEPIEITLTRDQFVYKSAKLIAQKTEGRERSYTRRVLAYFIRDLADILFTTNENND